MSLDPLLLAFHFDFINRQMRARRENTKLAYQTLSNQTTGTDLQQSGSRVDIYLGQTRTLKGEEGRRERGGYLRRVVGRRRRRCWWMLVKGKHWVVKEGRVYWSWGGGEMVKSRWAVMEDSVMEDYWTLRTLVLFFHFGEEVGASFCCSVCSVFILFLMQVSQCEH
jgi:hypothetical protein